MAQTKADVFLSTQDTVTDSDVLSTTQDPVAENEALANSVFVVACILLPIIIIGNLIVIIAIIKEMRKGCKDYAFILSLATADVLLGVLIAPIYVYYTSTVSWTLGRTLCNAWLIVDWTVVGISQLTIFLITFDRYLRVTFPVAYEKWVTPGKIDAVIVLSWILPFIFYPVFILVPKPDDFVYDDTVCGVPIMNVPWISITFGAILYWIPVVLMVFFYSRIYKASTHLASPLEMEATGVYLGDHSNNSINDTPVLTLIKNNNYSDDRTGGSSIGHNTEEPSTMNVVQNVVSSIVDPRRPSQAHKSSRGQGNDAAAHTSKWSKGTKTKKQKRIEIRRQLMKVSFILGSYLFFSSPLAIIFVMLPLCDDLTCVPNTLYQICYGMYYVNSALNPFLYAGTAPALWHAMKNVMYCRW